MKVFRWLAVIFLLCAGVLTTLGANAQSVDSIRQISLTGQGEVSTTPDMAEISMSVVSIKRASADAKTDVDTRFNNYLSALLELGIDKEDIVAATLRTNPQYSRIISAFSRAIARLDPFASRLTILNYSTQLCSLPSTARSTISARSNTRALKKTSFVHKHERGRFRTQKIKRSLLRKPTTQNLVQFTALATTYLSPARRLSSIGCKLNPCP